MRLEYVEWEDASTRAGWMAVEELREYAACEYHVRQSGFVVEETSRYLVLAGSWAPENDWHSEKFGDVTRIPKPWIRKRRTLMTVKP